MKFVPRYETVITDGNTLTLVVQGQAAAVLWSPKQKKVSLTIIAQNRDDITCGHRLRETKVRNSTERSVHAVIPCLMQQHNWYIDKGCIVPAIRQNCFIAVSETAHCVQPTSTFFCCSLTFAWKPIMSPFANIVLSLCTFEGPIYIQQSCIRNAVASSCCQINAASVKWR